MKMISTTSLTTNNQKMMIHMGTMKKNKLKADTKTTNTIRTNKNIKIKMNGKPRITQTNNQD